jgi:hypothetical protein
MALIRGTLPPCPEAASPPNLLQTREDTWLKCLVAKDFDEMICRWDSGPIKLPAIYLKSSILISLFFLYFINGLFFPSPVAASPNYVKRLVDALVIWNPWRF